jgi:hypothetical protein
MPSHRLGWSIARRPKRRNRWAKSINMFLPVELMREIFLYGIESNRIKSHHLASVCRNWRDIIITISHLWSTLWIGDLSTTREQIATWLQRASHEEGYH